MEIKKLGLKTPRNERNWKIQRTKKIIYIYIYSSKELIDNMKDNVTTKHFLDLMQDLNLKFWKKIISKVDTCKEIYIKMHHRKI